MGNKLTKVDGSTSFGEKISKSGYYVKDVIVNNYDNKPTSFYDNDEQKEFSQDLNSHINGKYSVLSVLWTKNPMEAITEICFKFKSSKLNDLGADFAEGCGDGYRYIYGLKEINKKPIKTVGLMWGKDNNEYYDRELRWEKHTKDINQYRHNGYTYVCWNTCNEPKTIVYEFDTKWAKDNVKPAGFYSLECTARNNDSIKHTVQSHAQQETVTVGSSVTMTAEETLGVTVKVEPKFLGTSVGSVETALQITISASSTKSESKSRTVILPAQSIELGPRKEADIKMTLERFEVDVPFKKYLVLKDKSRILLEEGISQNSFVTKSDIIFGEQRDIDTSI